MADNKHAVYVRLLGGLGNQLFQYAMGRALSDARQTELVLDPRFILRKGCISGLAIDEFAIRARYLTDAEAAHFKEPVWKLTRALRRQINPWMGYYHETVHSFDSAALVQSYDVMLSGFWQSERYFDNHSDLLQSDLVLKKALPPEAAQVAAQMKCGTSVAMHVRRGDYLSDPKALAKHGATSAHYYQTALQLMIEKLGGVDLYVFSDDPEWVRANIQHPSITFVSDFGFSAEQDLWLISACQHQIIANSSFSWWGAYLNDYASKIVVAPEPWFDAKHMAQQDIIPTDWNTLAK
ncbi:alpha-1,2-fucosyltransferase [Candidatus Njordibacter sp. Uisw_039]|uniref:alpha-1,2-fucosyltransferase n=1 Tax=Candidatus Njordibacter sp. Uisw_039 TaxID=3230972 RepID=UPI003D5CEFE3